MESALPECKVPTLSLYEVNKVTNSNVHTGSTGCNPVTDYIFKGVTSIEPDGDFDSCALDSDHASMSDVDSASSCDHRSWPAHHSEEFGNECAVAA